jgi:hypothetical protein
MPASELAAKLDERIGPEGLWRARSISQQRINTKGAYLRDTYKMYDRSAWLQERVAGTFCLFPLSMPNSPFLYILHPLASFLISLVGSAFDSVSLSFFLAFLLSWFVLHHFVVSLS